MVYSEAAAIDRQFKRFRVLQWSQIGPESELLKFEDSRSTSVTTYTTWATVLKNESRDGNRLLSWILNYRSKQRNHHDAAANIL